MSMLADLAAFVQTARYEMMSDAARTQQRLCVLDGLACALGALDAPLMARLRAHTDAVGGGEGGVTLIGGGRAAVDRAAFYNGALVRYLDFNDSYLAPKETCHPSDNLAAVLAAGELAQVSGKQLLTALAVAYQVQTRLCDVAPVRQRGFDHTTQGAYAVAAGVAKALGLDAEQTANAIAISGTVQNPLRVSRTGALSNWKGLAYPHTAFVGTHAALLAAHGVTGPAEVFEGNKGFMDSVAGRFSIDWRAEDLEQVRRTILKRFNAEVHSQSTLEALWNLRHRHGVKGADVERVRIDTFDVAFNIIGGGEEGNKKEVRTKEQADHSLPYLVAVLLLDGDVGPRQYTDERIRRADVQDLLRRVDVRAVPELSARFPGQMPTRCELLLRDGRRLQAEASDYEGFVTRPMSSASVVAKLERLAAGQVDSRRVAALVDRVDHLEQIDVAELMRSLAERRNT